MLNIALILNSKFLLVLRLLGLPLPVCMALKKSKYRKSFPDGVINLHRWLHAQVGCQVLYSLLLNIQNVDATKCCVSVGVLAQYFHFLIKAHPTSLINQTYSWAIGVKRISALSSRNNKRYSAREVNTRYGSLVPSVQRSSTNTPV